MKADDWDERYRHTGLVWGGAPNRWVEQIVTGLPPRRALDLACGEGRNALWLAGLGWRVTAVDFSLVGLDKARALERRTQTVHPVNWVHADVITYRHSTPVELALMCYVQLETHERRPSVRQAAASLAPGGVLLVIGHHTDNLTEGVGGPQDLSVLFSAGDIVEDLDGVDIIIDRAEAVRRPVEGAPRPAIDTLLRAHRPSGSS